MGYALRLALGLVITVIAFGQITIRTICSAGCQYTPTQLQNAVTAANPGDIITIDPASGATTVTGLELPAKPNPSHLYVTIRSANIYKLTGNTRVLPTDPNLATIAYTFPGYLTMYSDASASFYRFEGIKFTIPQGQAPTNMIQFGRVVSGVTFDNQVSQLPHDIDFDRCVFAGWQGSVGPYRAIAANMGRMSITNSTFWEIKAQASESQDVTAWNGSGPFYFRNNHFEASTMETLFGGAQPNISGQRAADMFFIGNEYYKPWTWRIRGWFGIDTQGQPPSGSNVCMYDSRGGEWWIDTTSAVGSVASTLFNCTSGSWQPATENAFLSYFPETTTHVSSGTGAPTGTCTAVGYYYRDTANLNYYACSGTAGTWNQITLGVWIKNLSGPYFEKNQFELKNAMRVLVEGNYLHQSWLPANLNQHGACILLNQVDNANNSIPPHGEPATVIANVVLRYNHCDQTPWGVSDGYIGTYFFPMHDISAHDNLFSNVGSEPFTLGDAQVIQLGAQGHYSFMYNTAVGTQPTGGFSSDLAPEKNVPLMQQIEYIGNIVPYNKLGFYDEQGHGNLWDAIDANWNLNRSFTKNAVVDFQGTNTAQGDLLTKSDKPPFSGLVPCSSCAVPRYFENAGVNDIQFVNYNNGDYHLKSTSPYAGWWAHGRPAGADIDQVLSSTAQALTGNPNPFLDFQVRALAAARTSASITYTAYDLTACTVVASTRPDLVNPVFTAADGAGDMDRTISVTGLTAGTRYFYSLTCAGYKRSGQFLTNP